MNELKRIVADMESVFAESSYPQDFLAAYDQMECLSSHVGRETFFVQRKEGGETAVATCYDRFVFPFRPDIRLLQELHRKGLPRYYEEYQNEKMLCIVREYIEGEPLSEYAHDRQLSLEKIISIAEQLCDILQALHTHEPPIVHRDIKPENVIVKPDGEIVLIDFDIARAVKEDVGTDTVFFGTKGYAPPEQYGFGQTDNRADIYAFGVLLRWLVTGNARKNKNIAIDENLQDIIDRCTAFSPEERYGDIGQVRHALGSIGKRKYRFNPKGAALLALAALLMLCVGFAAGRYTDWLRPTGALAFREPLIEKAVRLRLGKETGELTQDDLAQIDRLFIFGTEVFRDIEQLFHCRVDDYAKGTIRTLDDLRLLPNLEELRIVHQGYVDTSGISALQRLRCLELKHMRISSVAPIAELKSLRDVSLFYSGVSDVSALERCERLEILDVGYNDIANMTQIGSYPNLKRLCISNLEMENVNDIARRMPKVQDVLLGYCEIEDLSGLRALQNLQVVTVHSEQADAVKALFDGTNVQVVTEGH